MRKNEDDNFIIEKTSNTNNQTIIDNNYNKL